MIIQKNIHVQDFLIGECNPCIYNGILDDAAFEHRDNQELSGLDPGKLHKLELCPVCLRTADHGGVIRAHREDFRHLAEHVFQPVHPVDDQCGGRSILFLQRFILFLYNLIHVKPVSLIRRNPARRCMRLYDIPHLLQVRHLIADGGGTELQIRIPRDGSGTYRFSGLEVGLDNCFQNLYLSLIQFHGSSCCLCSIRFVLVSTR